MPTNANQCQNFVSIAPIFFSIQYLAITLKLQEEILQQEGRGPQGLDIPRHGGGGGGLETTKSPEKAESRKSRSRMPWTITSDSAVGQVLGMGKGNKYLFNNFLPL